MPTSSICSVARAYDDDLPCGAVTEFRVTAACVHEHLTTDEVCGGCLDRLRAAHMVCVGCDGAIEQPHLCRSAVLAVEALAAPALHR